MRYRIKLALILISMLIWGVSYPVVKILLNSGMQPITLATLRNFIFIPLLFYILAGKRYARYSRSDMILCVALAFFTVFLPNISSSQHLPEYRDEIHVCIDFECYSIHKPHLHRNAGVHLSEGSKNTQQDCWFSGWIDRDNFSHNRRKF
ncbi:MAG: DMT family transporter [Thermoplasmata archaeon]|nr:MAG: DMT family transporter [Thermoplasmata archaeon]